MYPIPEYRTSKITETKSSSTGFLHFKDNHSFFPIFRRGNITSETLYHHERYTIIYGYCLCELRCSVSAGNDGKVSDCFAIVLTQLLQKRRFVY